MACGRDVEMSKGRVLDQCVEGFENSFELRGQKPHDCLYCISLRCARSVFVRSGGFGVLVVDGRHRVVV